MVEYIYYNQAIAANSVTNLGTQSRYLNAIKISGIGVSAGALLTLPCVHPSNISLQTGIYVSASGSLIVETASRTYSKLKIVIEYE